MNDDDFSNIVRSGTEHHVSVSEHTGNAKNPKNVVTSHAEETEARRRAFEEKALAAVEAEKALAAALAEHTEHIASDNDSQNSNIQKLAASQVAANRASLAKEGAAKPNVQNVATDVLEANQQKVGTDKIQDNIQSVGNGKGVAPNVQNISTDVIAANQQSVGGGKAFAANTQTIAQDSLGINRQGLDKGPAASANLQALPKDDVAANRQSVGQEGDAKNQQGISANAIGPNEQKLALLAAQDNKQTLEQDSFANNRQPIPQGPGITPNNQAIGAEAPSLNRQAAPQDAPAGPNLQGVGNDNIESHFEPLPSGDVERKKVDFPTDTHTGNTTQPPAESTASNTAKRNPAAAQRPPLTKAEQLQQAKLKREQINDAFHGRLAGIKHNVDALNDRLTNFEDNVLKKNAKLDKGNPEDFDFELD